MFVQLNAPIISIQVSHQVPKHQQPPSEEISSLKSRKLSHIGNFTYILQLKIGAMIM